MSAPRPSAPRVYTCFDATGSKNPASTDLKYYFLLRAWERSLPLARAFVDVHSAAEGCRSPVNLRRELLHRMQWSDLLLLIVTERTARSTGWLSWELECATMVFRLPIVCAYTRATIGPKQWTAWWPEALHRLVRQDKAKTVHVPFKPRELAHTFRTLQGSRPELSCNSNDDCA